MKKKPNIGLFFLLAGLFIILFFYFAAGTEGFMIAAILGSMAMAFGGFQLFLAKSVDAQLSTTGKSRKSKRS